ncbi:MAG: VTT domain-containing protein [Planctomycetota bacterium]
MTQTPPSSPSHARLLTVIALVLAAPIVPALAFGELGAGWIEAWRESPPAAGVAAAAIGGALALDIVAPLPSGPLMTLAGALLGGPVGTLVGWLGLTVGAGLGYVAARVFGPRVASRLVSAEDLAQMRGASAEWAVWVLLATRPLPVLAEAAVLWAGLVGVPWARFFAPVAWANLILAGAYASLGVWAADGGWLLVALSLACVAPLVLLLVARRVPVLRAMSGS